MPDDIRIEQAGPDDFDSLVELHVRSWRTAYAGVVSDKFLATGIWGTAMGATSNPE